MQFSLEELVSITQGTLYRSSPQPDIPRDCFFSIDTRIMLPDQVFVALKGEKSDGHDYLLQAAQKGARGVIVSDVERTAGLEGMFIIQVTDTLHALQAIAAACRKKHPIPTVGITGSNGKTTVKDMTASILSRQYRMLKSQKSFNNHIGLPLTLANMTEQHELAVLEMGMNAPGEIAHLASLASPHIGAVTNISQAHVGYFKSIEAIMQAKMELIDALPLDGIAILNRDDSLFPKMRERALPRQTITFGINAADSGEKPTVTARNITASSEAKYAFDLEDAFGSVAISLQIPGYHNVSNALAAAAIVRAMHLSGNRSFHDHIKDGLEQFEPSPMRMQVKQYHDIIILNDVYNANPTSMASALRTLHTYSVRGKKFAVLGDMLELGDLSQSAHYNIGKLAAEAGVNVLLLFGQYAPDIARGAMDHGMTANQIIHGESHAQLAGELARQSQAGDLILCKGSRGMAMEKVLEAFMQ